MTRLADLAYRRGLVKGIANDRSIAAGCGGVGCGCLLLCVAFYGSERGVEHYNLIGPVKAALELAARCAVFLVSDAARRITGTIIPVGSGQRLLA